MLRSISLVFLLVISLANSCLARVKSPLTRIEVDPGDTPLVITGNLTAGQDLSGNIRLVARQCDVRLFNFLPSDLMEEEGKAKVGRQQVEMLGEKSLQVNVPKDFHVKVKGIKIPGTYRGRIEILPAGQMEPLVVPLQVIARAKPVLTPLEGTKKLDLSLVGCFGPMDDFLARRLLPESAFLEKLPLSFDNSGLAAVVVEDVGVVAQGKFTGYPLSHSDIAFSKGPQTFPANAIVSLNASLHGKNIPPDHYTGTIYLTLQGADQRLALPLDLKVRSGPFWPLVVLLVGILLGRLFKYMQERGRPQSEALQAVYRTDNLVNSAPLEDRNILAPMVAEIRKAVYQEKLETVTKQLAAVEDRLQILAELRNIEVYLQTRQQYPAAMEALKLVARVRHKVQLKDDARARSSLAELKTVLAKVQDTMMGTMAQADPEMAAVARSAETATQAAGRAAQAPAPISHNGSRLKNWLASLSGLSDEIRAEATLWVVSPLLYFALLLGILGVGISTLYIDKGATFGAHPFMDYFSLVLWGLSADVVSRNLSNLGSGGSK